MTKTVCLVDGSGYIFRAFYGIPNLTSPDGVPVNAVYGFTNMFLRLTAACPASSLNMMILRENCTFSRCIRTRLKMRN